MGCRNCIQVVAEEHSTLCKLICIFLIVLSIGFIIGGSVLIALNKEAVYSGEPTFDQARHYAGGLALLVIGFIFFFISLIACCCAFQLKIIGRILNR